jgi:hypothetical protein
MVDIPRERSDEIEDRDDPVEDANALVHVADDSPTPPPLDVDERAGHRHGDTPIAMPAEHETGHQAQQEKRSGWNTTIDELIPLPQDEPYHDDDSASADPYDAQDQVDVHVPPATGDAAETVDDFSTEEELDVDNAPGSDASNADDTAVIENATDVDPGTEPLSFEGSPAEDIGAGADTGSDTVGTGPTHSTTCPTCGQQTDALRFCGHCGASLTEHRHVVIGDTQVQRLMSRAAGFVEPLTEWTRPGGVRAILAIGAVLALIALLANSGGLALVIGAAILPAIILFWCRRSDVFENEPLFIVAGFSFVGIVLGALLGWLGGFTVSSSWFDEGVLNFGAAGFGGRFAEAAGSPSFMVWLVCGLLVPALALAAIIASPLLSKQFASLGNEIMDGLTVAAALGGGYAIGTAIVFVAPMFGQDGPAISASGWTLTTIGLTVIRPLIWTLAGGMIGAAAWRYLMTGRLRAALIPGVAGIAAPLLSTLISIQVSVAGLWAEVIAGAIIAAATAVLYQRTLVEAVRDDRRVLGNDDSRVVCPHCHRVTPAGAFCAHCGQPVGAAAM